MASPDEIELGRVLVNRGLLTQEQVLALVRERNQQPGGPGLGELLVQRGVIAAAQLSELREAVSRGEGKWLQNRSEAATSPEISLAGTREAVARECLAEALEALTKDRAGAVQELRRLVSDFPDTESGLKAREHLARIEAEG